MNFSQLRKRVANFEDREFTRSRYAICNAFGLLAIVYADNEQDAVDAAADSGRLDGELVDDDLLAEFEANEWTDSFLLAGNASEPFWCEYMSIVELPK